MKLLAVVFAIIPSFVLVLAGYSKWVDPTESLIFFHSGLGVPVKAADVVIAVVSVVEMAVGCWLAYAALGQSKAAGFMALSIFIFFFGLLLSVINSKNPGDIDCGCYGSLQIPWTGRSFTNHFIADGVLAAMVSIHIGCIHVITRHKTKTKGMPAGL